MSILETHPASPHAIPGSLPREPHSASLLRGPTAQQIFEALSIPDLRNPDIQTEHRTPNHQPTSYNRMVPFEELSRAVRLTGASNFREFAKRFAFRHGTEVRRHLASSKDPANAYATIPATSQEHLSRLEKVGSVEASATIIPISRHTVLYQYEVPIDNLPPQLEGIQILQLSDVHFEHKGKAARRREEEIESLAADLRKIGIRPEIVVTTGDIITKRAEDFTQRGQDALDRFDASITRCAVLGNHDFYNQGQGEVRHHLHRLGYADLTNAQLTITIDGKRINLFGVDDHLEGVPKPPVIRPGQENDTNIMVVHNLDAVQKNYPKCMDLILSGHTHAGEVNLGVVTGSDFMRWFGYLDGLNGHTKGWSSLTDRTLSYISPGHATHYFRYRTYKAGGTILKLTGHKKSSEVLAA